MKRFSLLLLAVSISTGACVQSVMAAPKYEPAMQAAIDPDGQVQGTSSNPLQGGVSERTSGEPVGFRTAIEKETTARPTFAVQQPRTDIVQPAVTQRPLNGQVSQPWNLPTGSWHVTDQPGNTATPSTPWNVPTGGWHVQSGGWGQQAQPQTPVSSGGWNVQSQPWNVKSGGWNAPTGGWNVQSGSWPEAKQGNWNQKSEPWRVQGGPWGVQSGSWGLEMGSWHLQVGPGGVRLNSKV